MPVREPLASRARVNRDPRESEGMIRPYRSACPGDHGHTSLICGGTA